MRETKEFFVRVFVSFSNEKKIYKWKENMKVDKQNFSYKKNRNTLEKRQNR